MDKYEELYKLSKAVFDEEQSRFNQIDEKASYYLSVLTLLLGVAGYFASRLIELFLPPHRPVEFILLALAFLIVVSLLASWAAIFSVIRVHTTLKIPLDDQIFDLFNSQDSNTIFYSLSIGIKHALMVNRQIGDNKAKKLYHGYRFICSTVLLLVLFAGFFGYYTWHEPKPHAKGASTMSENDSQKPDAQSSPNLPDPPKPSPAPPASPTTSPGAQPVVPTIIPLVFPGVTSGYDPSNVEVKIEGDFDVSASVGVPVETSED